MNQAQVDFQQLRIKHILFKSKVRSVLYGGKKDEAFFSHSGPLSAWFGTVGTNRYNNMSEMRELAKVQQELNATSDYLFRLYAHGKMEQALTGLQQIEEQSGKFLQLLSKLEEKVSALGEA